MIFGLFRRATNDLVIDRLYALVVAASRQPSLYRDMAVPDTFEGRFESLTVHAVLVLRRLKESEAPGPEIAQHLVDTVFKHFDRTLREMGVGDTTVPKRMKGLAEAFLGRAKAYDEAMRGGPVAIVPVLKRNIVDNADNGAALTRYVSAVADMLASAPLQAFIDGTIVFPEPAAFVAEITA